MKLGTQTNNMTNHIYSRSVKGQPEPTVGMGVTLLGWTDREAGTVVEVIKTGAGVIIGVQEDNAKRTDNNGMSEMQEYEYTPNTEAGIQYFRFGKDNRWNRVSKNTDTRRWNKVDGKGLMLGRRDKYHDFTF